MVHCSVIELACETTVIQFVLSTELVNSDFSAGSHEVSFNAEGLTSGIYLYRMKAENYITIKKMILLR